MTSRAKLLILLCIGLVGFLPASPAWADYATLGITTVPSTGVAVDTTNVNADGDTVLYSVSPAGGADYLYVDEHTPATDSIVFKSSSSRRTELFNFSDDTTYTDVLDSIRILVHAKVLTTAAASDTEIFWLDTTAAAGGRVRIGKFGPLTASWVTYVSPAITAMDKDKMARIQAGFLNYTSAGAEEHHVAWIALQRFFAVGTQRLIEDTIRGGIWAMASDVVGASAESVTVYLPLNRLADVVPCSVKTAIYNANLHSGGASLLVDSSAMMTITDTVPGWYSMAMINHASMYADTLYWVVAWSRQDIISAIPIIYNAASTGDTMLFKPGIPGAWAASYSGLQTTAPAGMSIYATYTASSNSTAQAPAVGKCIWGDTIVGASQTSIKGIIATTRTLCPQTAIIDSVMTFLQTSGLSTPKAKVAIYVDILNSHADTLLTNGTSAENTTFTSGSFWRGFTYVTPPTVTGGVYYGLAAWANATSTTFAERTRVTSSSDSIFTQTLAYTGTFPSPATQAFLITRTLAFEVFYSCNRRKRLIQLQDQHGEVKHDTTQLVRWIENFLPETDDAK